jgi:hypothetical protein
MDPALEAGQTKGDADVRTDADAGAPGAKPRRVAPPPDVRTSGKANTKPVKAPAKAPAKTSAKAPAKTSTEPASATPRNEHSKSSPKAKAGTEAAPKFHVWAEDVERLQGIMARLHEAFGADLSDVHFSRSMPQAPIDTVQAGIGRVTPSGIKTVLAAIGEEASITNATFTVTARLLPERAAAWSAREGARGPYDRGRAAPSRIREILQRLKASKGVGLKLHDNLYGRSAEIIEKEEGCYLVRTVSPTGLRERRRMTVPELAFLVDRGWWTT